MRAPSNTNEECLADARQYLTRDPYIISEEELQAGMNDTDDGDIYYLSQT